ncbi:hypothetical protein HanIR_Chr02g0055881 [Helianthus annuus]|nr:hypothetical protein HanIR_Chr02g0055881 [Helianthus annuus]
MLRMMVDRVSAWWISKVAPPGYAKTFVTPSRSSASTRTSDPFLGSSGPNLETTKALCECECLAIALVIMRCLET